MKNLLKMSSVLVLVMVASTLSPSEAQRNRRKNIRVKNRTKVVRPKVERDRSKLENSPEGIRVLVGDEIKSQDWFDASNSNGKTRVRRRRSKRRRR